MNTRKFGGVLLLLTILSSLISVLVYDYMEAILLIVSFFVIGLYILYVIDERTKPHITINDWILGKFPIVSEMDANESQRRLNILRYKSEEGPFKIRFFFNRRFEKETINEYKSKLKSKAGEES